MTTSENLIRADTPAKDALDEASRIRRKYDDSVARLTKLKWNQEVLKMPPIPIPEVDDFAEKFRVRHRLWDIRFTFARDQRTWYHENFREQDAAAIVATVKERESELVKLRAKLGRDVKDEVLEAATADVKNVSRHSALIGALGTPSMQEKHWANVWSLVETQPSTLLNFTLHHLLQAGIDAHFERVEEISAFAAGEATILKTVADIASHWDETYFTVKPYRDTKDRFFITEIDDLITQLEDDQMTV